jgi:hypothetical protein
MHQQISERALFARINRVLTKKNLISNEPQPSDFFDGLSPSNAPAQ